MNIEELIRWRSEIRKTLEDLRVQWNSAISDTNKELSREDIPAWRRREMDTSVVRGTQVLTDVDFFLGKLSEMPLAEVSPPEEPFFIWTREETQTVAEDVLGRRLTELEYLTAKESFEEVQKSEVRDLVDECVAGFNDEEEA